MRRGVFGGAFDPPHSGHLIIAEGVMDALHLDCVLFVPYTIGPHRPGGPVVGSRHRLEMLELALQDNNSFRVDDRELRRGGVSFTIETLLNLREDYPEDELVLIVGSDQLPIFSEWREWESILDLAEIAVVERPGHSLKEGPAELQKRIISVSMPLLFLSSTMVRERVAAGRSIRNLVPQAVADYIGQLKLYTDSTHPEGEN